MVQTQMKELSEDTDILEQGARDVSVQEVRQAIETLRAQAVANGVADMSMDEIDAIIAECRREMRVCK